MKDNNWKPITEKPKKAQLCLCYCPEWCDSGYQVAKYNSHTKKFDYMESPNSNFHNCVIGWMAIDMFYSEN